MTKMQRALSLALAISISSACNSATNHAELTAQDSSCIPALEIINEEPLTAQAGVWEITFSVALVGCRSSLGAMTAMQKAELIEEYLEPTAWSILEVQRRARERSFRSVATSKTNQIIGRSEITDVLFFNVAIYD